LHLGPAYKGAGKPTTACVFPDGIRTVARGV
jgi:hypothetical protein